MSETRKARAPRALLWVLLCGALVVGPADVAAQSPSRMEALLDSAHAAMEAPGAIVGFQRGDDPAVVVAIGEANRETGLAMAEEQPFYLGSVSKSWTAVVVLGLRDEGLLNLDDPIARWLPDFPRADEITVRQLLAHTSGLRDFYSWFYYRPDRDEMVELVTRRWTRAELIELAGRFGHGFDPGEDWAYSNSGYFLLGVVAERASGQSLAELYRSRIFEPLGIESAWIEGTEPALGTLPIGYLGPVEGWEHSSMFGALGPTTVLDAGNAEWAAGGLAAPASEALRFLHALMRGRLLEPGSLAEMMTFRDTPPLGVPDPEDDGTGSGDGYGLGLVRMTVGGRVLVGHGGLYNGHTAGLWHVMGCDLTIATYVNRGFVGQRALLASVIPALLPGSRCDST